MIRKYLSLTIILVVSLCSFLFPFTYVEAGNAASAHPQTCYWPSKTMSDYFAFQNELIQILVWWKLNSLQFSSSFGNLWLFSNKVLGLSAIGLVADNVAANTASFVSNATTSTVLLSLAAASVLQSGIEWLAILFKDRPIVRDYKQMLDIETRLFDVAYFRSKEIDLTLPIDDEGFFDNLDKLIKKYQKEWLLEPWASIRRSETMADIVYDMIAMNASMKHFIMIGGKLWKAWLKHYNWCFWNISKDRCNEDTSILRFKQDAIDTLYKDYKDVRTYGKCNSYASFFKSSLNRTINNNVDSVKMAGKDVKEAIKRLKGALMWSYNKKTRENRCDMTDYEMSQLQAYWWWNWRCGKSLVNVDTSSALLEIRDYSNKKKAQREQTEKVDTFIKKAEKSGSKDVIIWEVLEKLKGQKTNADRESFRFKIYGENNLYNYDFSFDMGSDFVENFWIVIDQYWQAQQNAISADISDLFVRGRWILTQVDTTIKKTDALEERLQKIEDKQCNG